MAACPSASAGPANSQTTLSSQPVPSGLAVEVDDNGNGDNAERAESVRGALIASGVPPGSISIRTMGNSRPTATNNTTAGREANRRVEITISGAGIGNMPYWDRSYSIVPR